MLQLGVDFGTANTRISMSRDGELPQPVRIGRDSSFSPYLMPSAVLIDRTGQVLVGEDVLSRVGRLKHVKRYWQMRPEDLNSNPWRDGTITVDGKTFTCEQVVEAIVREATSRVFSEFEPPGPEGYCANIVCPVTFDLSKRNALAHILSNRGARSVTLGNVIDEPLASAVLYGRVAISPPVNKDLLIFDAGAGTLDLAIVRYHEEGGQKKITVLAEQGRCRAGSDLDRAMEGLILDKIRNLTGVENPEQVYGAYHLDPRVGKVMFEEECEQRKRELAKASSIRWRKPNFLAHPLLEFEITRRDFEGAASAVLDAVKDALNAVCREAKFYVEDFDGVDLVLLVGGTSKLPFIRDEVSTRFGGEVIHNDDVYFDELIATVRGAGFSRDFEDLILKRPPYSVELRAVLSNGASRTVEIHQAFDQLGHRWQSYSGLPTKEVKIPFEQTIETVEIFFVSPSGNIQRVNRAVLPADYFRGKKELAIRLTVKANLTIEAGHTRRTLKMPYFTQVGLKPSRPFDPAQLNLPDVYPAEN